MAAAFAFFDVDGSGKITTSNLRKRLGVFYKNMPAKDYRFLMNNKPELTLDDLKELLLDNEVTNFDPVAEAFKVYDPEGTGFIDTGVLRSMFESLGFGEVTDEDLMILIETGDVDKDGKISPDELKKMLSAGHRDSVAIFINEVHDTNSDLYKKKLSLLSLGIDVLCFSSYASSVFLPPS